MKKAFINTALAKPQHYAHAATVTGSELLFTSGGVPLDQAGSLVGQDNIEEQTELVVRNLLSVLSANSYGVEHIVKLIVYVVTKDDDHQQRAWSKLIELGLANDQTAATLVGVNALGYKGQLIEVEVIAAT